jgi:hypothetical protein
MNLFNNIGSISDWIGKISGTKGSIEVGDDVIDYSAEGRIKGFKWRYIGVATSRKTGIGGSSNTSSASGAIEHALQDLFNKLTNTR